MELPSFKKAFQVFAGVFTAQGKLGLWAALIVCVAWGPAIAIAAEIEPQRVALIVANGNYQAVEHLPNAVSDGRLVAQAFKSIGFQRVTVVENATREQMERALQTFSASADGASVAVIYFAGHGMEINGSNYLVPIDAKLAQDRDVELETVKLDTMLQMSDGAKRLRIVILDACRNNPFLVTMKRSISSRGVSSGGLAPIEPKTDSLVAYSAKAGATASDGTGGNSPFARSLARRLVEPGREINLLFRRVRDDVLAETGGTQEPFTYGSLSHEEFYFVPDTTSGRRQVADTRSDISSGVSVGSAGRSVVDAGVYNGAMGPKPAYSDTRFQGASSSNSGARSRLAVGTFTAEKTCTTYVLEKGRESFGAAASAGAGAVAATDGYNSAVGYGASAQFSASYAREWETELRRECVQNFPKIRSTVAAAVAAAGPVVMDGRALTLNGRLTGVGYDTQAVETEGSSHADQFLVVSFEFNLKDAAGRIVYGGAVTKRINIATIGETADVSFTKEQSGGSKFAIGQQQVAYAIARAVIFHLNPLRIEANDGRFVSLNYGAPLVPLGSSVLASSPDSIRGRRLTVTGASGGRAVAESDARVSLRDLPAGSIVTFVEPDDPAANSRVFDRVELPEN